MDEKEDAEKAWIEFIEGNPELVASFGDALSMAFTAGWYAGKQAGAKK